MMKTIWSITIDEILKIGKPLANVGVFNWALTKGQALEVLDKFLTLQIPILGGDVYENIDGKLQPNLDNWYCEPKKEEAKIDFMYRSIKKAKIYIN